MQYFQFMISIKIPSWYQQTGNASWPWEEAGNVGKGMLPAQTNDQHKNERRERLLDSLEQEETTHQE
jgi:hypothetical protein